jgi:hypothetical protein
MVRIAGNNADGNADNNAGRSNDMFVLWIVLIAGMLAGYTAASAGHPIIGFVIIAVAFFAWLIGQDPRRPLIAGRNINMHTSSLFRHGERDTRDRLSELDNADLKRIVQAAVIRCVDRPNDPYYDYFLGVMATAEHEYWQRLRQEEPHVTVPLTPVQPSGKRIKFPILAIVLLLAGLSPFFFEDSAGRIDYAITFTIVAFGYITRAIACHYAKRWKEHHHGK